MLPDYELEAIRLWDAAREIQKKVLDTHTSDKILTDSINSIFNTFEEIKFIAGKKEKVMQSEVADWQVRIEKTLRALVEYVKATYVGDAGLSSDIEKMIGSISASMIMHGVSYMTGQQKGNP